MERGGQVGGARLEGVVLDDRGAPAAGARVKIRSDGGDLPAVTTDEAGRFAVEGVAAEAARIDVRREDLYLEGARVRVRAGRSPVVLRMRRGMTLVVRVLADGAPIAGAAIVRGRDVVAATGPDGTAEVRGVAALFDAVTVTAPGRGAAILAISRASDPGGRLERTVTLPPGAPLGGVVVDADGQPVGGAEIRVVDVSTGGAFEATSDPSGRWRTGALAAGTYRVRAAAPGRARAPWRDVATDGAAPRDDLVVALGRGGRMRGEVVDETGAAVAGARVEADGEDEGDEWLARTDSTGSFELAGVVPGTYELLACTARRGSRAVEIEVAEGEVAAVRLVVEPSEVAGRVIRPDGSPVIGVEVGVRDDPRYGDVTDRDGQFELGALPPGRHVVEVTEEGRPAGSRRVRAGDAEVVITCQAPARLVGRALLGGRPMSWFGLQVGPSARLSFVGDATGFHAEDGRFSFPVPQPGDLDVVLAGPGAARRTLTTRVVPGQVVDLGDIELAPGRTIRGRVVDADGRPVAGATVTIGGDQAAELDPVQRWFRCAHQAVTDSDGRYAVEGVDPPRAGGAPRTSITARRAGVGAAIPSELPEEDAVPDLVLVPVGGIDGHITAAIEGGVSHMAVLARRRGSQADVRFSPVDAFGRFRFDDVPAGEHDLEVVAPRRTAGRPGVAVIVVAGERASVRIVLPPEP